MTRTLKLRRILAVLAIASASTAVTAKTIEPMSSHGLTIGMGKTTVLSKGLFHAVSTGDTDTDSYARALDCNETGAHLQIVTFDHDKVTSVAEMGFDPALRDMEAPGVPDYIDLAGTPGWYGFNTVTHGTEGDARIAYRSWKNERVATDGGPNTVRGETKVELLYFSGAGARTAMTEVALAGADDNDWLLTAPEIYTQVGTDTKSPLLAEYLACISKMSSQEPAANQLRTAAMSFTMAQHSAPAGTLSMSDATMLDKLFEGMVKPNDTAGTLKSRLESAGYKVTLEIVPTSHQLSLRVGAVRALGALKLPAGGEYRFGFKTADSPVYAVFFEPQHQEDVLEPSKEAPGLRYQAEQLFGKPSSEGVDFLSPTDRHYDVFWSTGQQLRVALSSFSGDKKKGEQGFRQRLLWVAAQPDDNSAVKGATTAPSSNLPAAP
jgi:hypothetical protein